MFAIDRYEPALPKDEKHPEVYAEQKVDGASVSKKKGVKKQDNSSEFSHDNPSKSHGTSDGVKEMGISQEKDSLPDNTQVHQSIENVITGDVAPSKRGKRKAKLNKPDVVTDSSNDKAEVGPRTETEDIRMKKYRKVQSQQDEIIKSVPVEVKNDENIKISDLTPIPQPDVVLDKGRAVSSSMKGTPDWLKEPEKTSPVEKGDFAKMNLSTRILERLQKKGFEAATAVQKAIIPKLIDDALRHKRGQIKLHSDICVAASTGSGKTLAYTIPIIEALAQRNLTVLSALILVPTRDLAQQVKETFDFFAYRSGIKSELVTGSRSLLAEQSSLVDLSLCELMGGNSLVDVIIATPGRLVEHIRHTKNFTLQHLEYLIIDEADKLLFQSFSMWAEEVTKEIQSSKTYKSPVQSLSPDLLSDLQAKKLYIQNAPFGSMNYTPLQKCIFSATMTRNTARLEPLKLRNPKLYTVEELSTPEVSNEAVQEKGYDSDEVTALLPSTLHEKYLGVTEDKPYALYLLVNKFGIFNTLIFVKSSDSCEVLSNILNKMGLKSKVYYGGISKKQRTKNLADFTNGSTNLLCCTDIIGRGMDLKSVQHIVNYDPPVTMQQYVHRVGRTARAGNIGHAWTLCLPHEARHFWQISRSVGRAKTKSVAKVKVESDETALMLYQKALSEMRQESGRT